MTIVPIGHDQHVHEDTRRGLMIYFGLSLIILAGLLILTGYPVDAIGQPFNESLPGERNMGDWFAFTMHNASGKEDATHRVTVYHANMLTANQSYTYWSVSSGQWFNKSPAKGKKWLFIWVEDRVEGTPIWGYDKDQFSVWVWGNTTIKSEAVQLEDLKRTQRSSHLYPATILEAQGRPVKGFMVSMDDPYGWRDGFQQPYIEPGQSNAWSGWIKYQVPENAMREDIQVAGWFMNYGTPYWNLAPRSFIQVSPTPSPAPITAGPAYQQVVNRISDQPGAPVIDGRQRG